MRVVTKEIQTVRKGVRWKVLCPLPPALPCGLWALSLEAAPAAPPSWASPAPGGNLPCVAAPLLFDQVFIRGHQSRSLYPASTLRADVNTVTRVFVQAYL